MHLSRLCEVCTPALYYVPVVIRRIDSLLHFCFYAVQLPGRKKFTIRQGVQSIPVSTDADKGFYMTVPRCQIFITNGPIYGIAITPRTFKIIPAPALGLPRP